MARSVSFGDDGEIITDLPKKQTIKVRFPTEAEQAKGITEIPRSTRQRESEKAKGASSIDGNKTRS